MNGKFTGNDRFVLESRRTAREIYRQRCAHEKWELVVPDPLHWSKRCLDRRCRKFFESESANSETARGEILI